jgi:hypothetical protein
MVCPSHTRLIRPTRLHEIDPSVSVFTSEIRTKAPVNPEVQARLLLLLEKANQRSQAQSHEMHRIFHDQQHQIQQLTQKMEQLLREMQVLQQQIQNIAVQPPVHIPVPVPYPNYPHHPSIHQQYPAVYPHPTTYPYNVTVPSPNMVPGTYAPVRPVMHFPVAPSVPAPAYNGPGIAPVPTSATVTPAMAIPFFATGSSVGIVPPLPTIAVPAPAPEYRINAEHSVSQYPERY